MSALPRDRVEAFLEDRPRWQADVLIVLAALAIVYVLFLSMGLLLGLDLDGIANTLARLTFYAASFSLLVLALNLHWGYTGLFNIGVAGFMSVGVFAMALVSGGGGVGAGQPLWLGAIAGVVAAALLGFVAALPALRLRADYFAIVTLGISEIVRLTLKSAYLREFQLFGETFGTGGGRSISAPGLDRYVLRLLTTDGTPRGDPTILGAQLFGAADLLGVRVTVVLAWAYAVALLLVAAVLYLLLARIGYSPFGRVLKAIREDELAAQTLGKDTARVKIISFMLGCAMMGLAGILWYGSRPTVSPDTFLPRITFFVFVALIIGGAGSNAGSIVGGIVFAGFLWEGPRMLGRLVDRYLDVSNPGTIADATAALVELNAMPMIGYVDANLDFVRRMFVGVVLIALMLRRPEGLLGHRKEIAAATDLSRPGGERDE